MLALWWSLYCWLQSLLGCVHKILQESIAWQLLLPTSFLFLRLLVVCHAFLPSVTDLVIDWPTQQVHTGRHIGRKNSKDRYSWAPHIVPNAIHLPQRAVASECGFRQANNQARHYPWNCLVYNEYNEWHIQVAQWSANREKNLKFIMSWSNLCPLGCQPIMTWPNNSKAMRE